MVDLNTQVSQIAVEILRSDPQASTKQLIEKLTAALERNAVLQAALKSDQRLLQINQGSGAAFQTWVEGGIANIGVHLHGVETQKLIEVVREVLRSHLPVGIAQNLPYSGTTVFVGREAEMADLHDQLGQDERVAISAISGMGGIGKTELALQYALEHLGLKTYAGGVCWVRAREEVGTQIVSFARSQLSLEPPEDLELLQKVQWCWRNWQAGEILTVFDDVQAYADVQPYLPPAAEPRFKVLMTTRLSRLATSVQNYEIQVLSEAAALKLLSAIAPDGRIDSQLADAKALCEWVGCLPLGLELVGRYLARKPDLSIAQLLQRLQDKRLEAKALKQAEPGMTASLGVAAAFELSWQELSAAAQQLAGLLSLFALAPIAWTLVEACLPEWDAEELEDLRDEALLGLHLLQRSGQEMYELHQLLREFFAAKRSGMAIEEEMKRSVCRVLVNEAREIPQALTLTLVAQFTPLIPHLAEIATALTDYLINDDLIQPYIRIGIFCQGQANYKQAEPWLEQCRRVAENRLGENHLYVAVSLNNLANLYEAQGRYLKAEPLYLRSLDIRESQLGANHLDVAASLNNLANLYELQGHYSKAESLCVRSLAIHKQQLPKNHPEMVHILNNLAELYRVQGHYDKAKLKYLRVLAILKQHGGKEHLFMASTLNNLALLYEFQGDFCKAKLLCERALTIRRQHLEETHPDVATSLFSMAAIHRAQGFHEEALPLLKQALDIDEYRYGKEHPSVASSLNGLASVYDFLNRYEDAEPLYVRALQIRESQLGFEHPDTATSLNNLAGLYCATGRYSEAEPLYLRAVAIFYDQLSENHPTTQTVWGNFVEFLKRAIASNQTAQLSDHPTTQAVLEQLRRS